MKNTYDHIQSVFREKLKEDSDKDEEYFISNIDKALGHIYRASFDAFDGLFTFMKKDLADYLKRYSPKTCNTVISNYFETKKNITIISEKLGELRGQKDAGKDLSPVFDSYVKEIDAFKSIKSDLERYAEELNEVQFAEDKEENRGKRIRLKGYKITIVAAVLTCLLTWFVTTQCNRQDTGEKTPARAETEASSPTKNVNE